MHANHCLHGRLLLAPRSANPVWLICWLADLLGLGQGGAAADEQRASPSDGIASANGDSMQELVSLARTAVHCIGLLVQEVKALSSKIAAIANSSPGMVGSELCRFSAVCKRRLPPLPV